MHSPKSAEERAKEKAEEMETHRLEAAKGARLDTFLRSEFWIKDLGPYLNADQKDCLTKGRYKGGAWPGMEAVAFQACYNGAQSDMIDRLMQTLKIWETKGAEAAAAIKREEERTKPQGEKA